MSLALQTLAVILIPVALPFVKKQYNAFRQYRTTPPRAYTAREVQRLYLLAILSVLHLVTIARALFVEEQDIYKVTNSRLMISTELLKKRYSNMGHTVPEEMWHLLEIPSGRLLYLRLGADPLLTCRWCSMEHELTFLYYALGPIALCYLCHLFLLACTTARYKSLATTVLLMVFLGEVYVRAGGLDHYNARSKTASDILFLHSWIPLLRAGFFLSTCALSSLKVFLDARYPRPQPSLSTIKSELVGVIETLRASNSLQRTIGDHEPLRSHASAFWSRNEEATQKLNRDERMVGARQSASSRNPQNTNQEIRQAREFLQATAQRSVS